MVMNRNINICVFPVGLCDPRERSFDPEGSHDPQVENYCCSWRACMVDGYVCACELLACLTSVLQLLLRHSLLSRNGPILHWVERGGRGRKHGSWRERRMLLAQTEPPTPCSRRALSCLFLPLKKKLLGSQPEVPQILCLGGNSKGPSWIEGGRDGWACP